MRLANNGYANESEGNFTASSAKINETITRTVKARALRPLLDEEVNYIPK